MSCLYIERHLAQIHWIIQFDRSHKFQILYLFTLCPLARSVFHIYFCVFCITIIRIANNWIGKMTRHARNCTAGAVYTYHEKKRDAAESGYGTNQQRIGKDSVKSFDCCSLTLQPCRYPVITLVFPITISNQHFNNWFYLQKRRFFVW